MAISLVGVKFNDKSFNVLPKWYCWRRWLNCGHYMRMWFTVSEVANNRSYRLLRCHHQDAHLGDAHLAQCVARVWPICSRLIKTASLRLSEPFCLVTPTVGLIARSLLQSGQFHISCHSLRINSLTRSQAPPAGPGWARPPNAFWCILS